MREVFNSSRHPPLEISDPFINCSPSAIATITVIQGLLVKLQVLLPVNEWVSECHLGPNQVVGSETGI